MTPNTSSTEFHVACPHPFSWHFFLNHLRGRLTPEIERIENDAYFRSIEIAGHDNGLAQRTTHSHTGFLSVRFDTAQSVLLVSITGPAAEHVDVVQRRLRSMFDLQTDLLAVHQHLSTDPFLAAHIETFPWIRIPGPWSPFELIVRTIVGQQVTVKAASTILNRIVQRGGRKLSTPLGELHLFPSPRDVAGMNMEKIGMPGRRVETLQSLAHAIATRSIPFPEDCGPLDGVREGLLRQPGIGPWTVEYFALRALRDGNAWPVTDLILKRAIARLHPRSRALAEKRARKWSPWRGYAAMRLWYGVGPAPAASILPPAAQPESG